ncbi:hypothetical protein ACHAPY_000826 [Fusarium culmorum]
MTDRNPATAAKSAKQELAKTDDGKAVNRDQSSNTATSSNQKTTPAKKRRKVNHVNPKVNDARSHWLHLRPEQLWALQEAISFAK